MVAGVRVSKERLLRCQSPTVVGTKDEVAILKGGESGDEGGLSDLEEVTEVEGGERMVAGLEAIEDGSFQRVCGGFGAGLQWSVDGEVGRRVVREEADGDGLWRRG